jgi:hypothetical protein
MRIGPELPTAAITSLIAMAALRGVGCRYQAKYHCQVTLVVRYELLGNLVRHI